jgi:glutathionyl-hydroquinone reductase
LFSLEPGAQFPPEKDRYHLFVSYACPWAHRTLITRSLKGLHDTISVTVVHPIWQKTRPGQDEHAGWIFGRPDGTSIANSEGRGGPFPACYPENEPNPFFPSDSIRDVYEHVNDQDGKYSVPILYDKKLDTIVNNESADIVRMFNSEFNEFATNPDLDLYPDDATLRAVIEEVNSWIYPNINNGVYRCGFAKSQIGYDQAIADLTQAFDKVHQILSKQRYIAGSRFTEADIRLFVTLLRFDEVYAGYFKTNTRSVVHCSPLLNYCRDIYQMPGVAETVYMEHIKLHYYCSHPALNTFSIVPKGIDFISMLEQPSDRDSM